MGVSGDSFKHLYLELWCEYFVRLGSKVNQLNCNGGSESYESLHQYISMSSMTSFLQLHTSHRTECYSKPDGFATA